MQQAAGTFPEGLGSADNSTEKATSSPESEPPVPAHKILTNRLNAGRSTGPKTPQGKANSRGNATKHGLLAGEVVLASPDGRNREYAKFLTQLRGHFKPANILEDLLVQRIVTCFWRQGLAIRAEIGESRTQQDTAVTGPSECSDPTHNDIVALWLRTQHDREHRRMSGKSNRELTGTEEQIIRRLRETHFGIYVVLSLLGEIRGECIKTGVVSQNHQDLLRDCYGREADFLLLPLSNDTANPSEQVVEFLLKLDEVMRTLASRRSSLQEMAEWHKQRLSVPDERADLLIRYDAHSSRELYRALGELERLQRRRTGDLVPPPIKVDVTGES